MDGTLIDSLGGIARAANALLAEQGLAAVPERQVAGYVGHGEHIFIDRLIADTALDAGDRAALLARFMTHYKAASRNTPLFPGVAEALARLKARGVALGLCTNKPGGPLAAVLDGLGWQSMFGAVVAGDTLARRKPDPAPLLHVFDRLGGRGVYVGDSPIDGATAQAAGVPFVLFTQGIRTVPVQDIAHDAAFDDFADLPGILDRLAG
nr:phosphoglycolate phosphatase [Thalassococcus arenae]